MSHKNNESDAHRESLEPNEDSNDSAVLNESTSADKNPEPDKSAPLNDEATEQDLREKARAVQPQQILVLRDFCIRYQGAACERCALACPHDALTFGPEQLPVINSDSCTTCGICLGICDAFTSTRVTMIDLHARVRRIALRGEEVVITCKENVFADLDPANNVIVLPCLATFPPELWALILAEQIPISIAADLSYCADCKRAGELGETLFGHAVQTAEAWTGCSVGFREDIPEKDNVLRDLANPDGVDRRNAFFNIFADVSDVASGKRRLRNSDVLQQFFEQRERSRARARLNLNDSSQLNNFTSKGRLKQIMHPKRQMLLEAIDRDSLIANRVSLTISKTNCDTCDNTLSCVSVCPTKARYPHADDGTLEFDVRYCIGCGLCVEACPHGAIDLFESSATALLTQEEA